MAVPSSREELKEYCLRKCGKPVIDINIDDSQVEDALDDALHFWREYHYSGTERTYLKMLTTQQDIDNKYYVVPEEVNSIMKVFQGGYYAQSSSGSLFNVEYQLRLNDLWDLSSAQLSGYYIARQYLAQLDDILNVEPRFRFNQYHGKVQIDWEWGNDIGLDQYAIIEVNQYINPEEFEGVYGNWVFRNLAAAYTKKRWGDNLSKFDGLQLPGGVTLNGPNIISEAKEEIERIEQDFIIRFQAPDEPEYG